MPLSNSSLTSNPQLKPVIVRELVIKAIRSFFEDRSFHEVFTPVLSSALPLEPNLYSFATTWEYLGKNQQLYLVTSPESSLKKMLAKGLGNCFALGKSFRNLEATGSKHNPEFMMLEWYREGADYAVIMQDVEQLVGFVSESLAEYEHHHGVQLCSTHHSNLTQKEWPVFSLEALFIEHCGVVLSEVLADEQLAVVASNKGYSVTEASWSELFDQLFLNEIEPHLPKTPFFLVDFPAQISPLCAKRADKPYLAERFEVYFGGMELGNGNTENTDFQAIQAVFEQEQRLRKTKQLPSHPIDSEFLSALKTLAETGRSYAGIGLGVDRLALVLSGASDITMVEPFTL